MMSWCDLDLIKGIAIDNNNTTTHHQLISLDNKQQVLHYTVFYEPLNVLRPQRDVPDSFVSDMARETPLDRDGKTKMTNSFAKFVNAIRPHGSNCGFELNEAAKALTFDIHYDHDYNMFGLSYRPTLGCMVKKMSYAEAGNLMHEDNDLRIIHSIAKTAGNSNKSGNLFFQDVIGRIGHYIGKQKLESDLIENLDTIFRDDDKRVAHTENDISALDDLPLFEWADRVNRYQSVVYYNDNLQGIAPPLRNAVVPTTASRDILDHFNIQQTTAFALYGQGMFDTDVSAAVVNYQKHVLAWKRQGMM